MTHLSLFSGIGGLDIAAEWAGFETVGQCEWADYPTKVLEKHWPDVPRWRDIRTLTKEDFFARTGLRTVDVISGGFPCQPFSVAGKQKGKEDDRYLWPEMLRVIRELTPRWVVGENVPGILRIAGRTVCEDLEREGYAVAVFNYEAAAVGALHRRERVFFVGNTQHNGLLTQSELRSNETAGNNRGEEKQKTPGELTGTDRPFDVSGLQGRERRSERIMADAYDKGLQISGLEPGFEAVLAGDGIEFCGCYVSNSHNAQPARQREHGRQIYAEPESKGFGGGCGKQRRPTEPRLGLLVDGFPNGMGGHWRVEPDIPRVAVGVKNRVSQLKAYGNAVVPRQAYPIFRAIAEVMAT